MTPSNHDSGAWWDLSCGAAEAEAFAPSALVKHGEDVCEGSWSPSPDPCENARASSQIVHMRPRRRGRASGLSIYADAAQGYVGGCLVTVEP